LRFFSQHLAMADDDAECFVPTLAAWEIAEQGLKEVVCRGLEEAPSSATLNTTQQRWQDNINDDVVMVMR
jgi:hypothetical protein